MPLRRGRNPRALARHSVLNHPNYLRIDRFGQFLIEEDDITAVYAVFDRVDANLGQVLEKGRLASSDAAQIGLSIASALEALHASGFVHEHVEPGTIFAVGETVKLRADCIRETPEGAAGWEARRRDTHDLALVLMHVLQGAPSAGGRQATLPGPFEEIVRKGITGEWSLAEIRAALASHIASKIPARVPGPPKPPPVAAISAAKTITAEVITPSSPGRSWNRLQPSSPQRLRAARLVPILAQTLGPTRRLQVGLDRFLRWARAAKLCRSTR